MMEDFRRLGQFTGDKALETVLKDHSDLRLLWERRPILKSPVEINGTNPILYILLESIIEHQVIKNDSPEVRSAPERLMKNWYFAGNLCLKCSGKMTLVKNITSVWRGIRRSN